MGKILMLGGASRRLGRFGRGAVRDSWVLRSAVYKGVGAVKRHLFGGSKAGGFSGLLVLFYPGLLHWPTKARAFNRAVETLVPPAIYTVFPP
jgi:hypothetical protein